MHSINHLFQRAGRLHFQCAHATLQKFGLGRGQPPVLRILEERGSCTQKEIAQMENISPATATVTLQTMERNGLIRRASDDKDGRAVRVFLTEKGKQVCRDSKAALGELSDRIFGIFSPEEQAELTRLYTKLIAHMEELQQGEDLG